MSELFVAEPRDRYQGLPPMVVDCSVLEDVAMRALEDFAQLKLTRCPVSSHPLGLLARRERLTAYDAAYLQLAIGLNASLVTYDRTLSAAAERVLAGR